MNTIMRWLDTQSLVTQLAIGIPVTIMRVWYPHESVEIVKAALGESLVREESIREALLTYLQMADERCDDDTVPEAVREFLQDESGLVTAILSDYVHAHGNFIDDLSSLNGPVTVNAIDRVLGAFAWSRLMTVPELAEISGRADEFGLRQSYHVIGEEVEAYARKRLVEGKSFPGFQYKGQKFLQRIVGLAPETRTLPTRVAATIAFLTAPD